MSSRTPVPQAGKNLIGAVSTGRLVMVKQILRDWDWSAQDLMYALHLAMSCGENDIVLLLEKCIESCEC